MHRKALFALVILVLAVSVNAQTPTASGQVPKRIAIFAGKLIDGKGGRA